MATVTNTIPPTSFQFYSVSEWVGDSSYASGGETVTFAGLGMASVDFAVCEIVAGSESSTLRPANAYYTPATEKLHLIDSATGKEMEATKDMSKVKVQIVAFGKTRAK
jgi:hypothetical protein